MTFESEELIIEEKLEIELGSDVPSTDLLKNHEEELSIDLEDSIEENLNIDLKAEGETYTYTPQKGFVNRFIPKSEKAGENLIESCDLATTYHIQVPTNHFSQNSDKIDYNYSIYHPLNRNKETVYILEIPGGPGGVALRDVERSRGQYPKHVGVITVDPRGLGCNLYPGDIVEKVNLSTKQHAQDLASILKAEKISKYIVLGGSYGTVVGTHLIHYIESEKTIPNPIGLILTGTLGKAHEGFSFNQPFVGLLDLIKHPKRQNVKNLAFRNLSLRLSETSNFGFDIPAAFRFLIEKLEGLPKGSEEWKTLDTELYYGWLAVVSGMKEGAARIAAAIDLVKLISAKHLKVSSVNAHNDLIHLDDQKAQEKIHYLIKMFKPFSTSGLQKPVQEDLSSPITEGLIKRSEELRNQVICSELGWLPEKIDFTKEGYIVTSESQQDCGEKEYFDAKDFPIKSQILYLQGGLDLQTTLEQSQYHFNAQSELGNKRLYGLTSMTSGHSFAFDYNQCGVWNDFLLKGDFHGFMQVRLKKQQSHCPIPFLRYDSERVRFYRATDGQAL